MAITSHLKFTLSDEASLATYLRTDVPSFEAVKRQLLIKAREQNRNIPDHYYRLEQIRSFESISSFAALLTRGFHDLATQCLDIDADKKIYVLDRLQNDWQELISYIPPLVLQCALITERLNEDPLTLGIRQYVDTYLLPNFCYTALPSPKIAQLDGLIAAQGGLYDLHMHLSGATETDVQWQDFLSDPTKIYNELRKGFRLEKVKEQVLQESPFLTPIQYISLLRTAQKLRHYFYHFLFVADGTEPMRTLPQMLGGFMYDLDDGERSNYHVFRGLLPEGGESTSSLAIEALMYILLLREIKRSWNETLAHLFHFYLLLLGLTNRLLVQQVHQKGFEQFQKHTLNRLREYTEIKYKARFLQIQGSALNRLRFLEGRFSPKDSCSKMMDFIKEIHKGWRLMERAREAAGALVAGPNQPELKLIAHFIKQADSKPDELIRHKKFRYDVWTRAKALAKLPTYQSEYIRSVVGIDAAASEFDAPPEVFAPAFRLLRRAGLQHFTYHAGEDFVHIIGGLRAMYEAIVFCGLGRGDRIGHGTAAGLSADRWREEIGDQLLIRQGEYLDNLVFLNYLIRVLSIPKLARLEHVLRSEIGRVSVMVFGSAHPISVLESAWLMRRFCPIHTIYTNVETLKLLRVFCPEELDFVLESGIAGGHVRVENEPAWHLYKYYHESKNRKSYDAVISIRPFEITTPEDISDIQLGLLSWMSTNEIVLETLPTSNVRIGFHRNFSSYQLLRWTDWHREGKPVPRIVVGTDDTGIFATNIYNEYSNIHCALQSQGRPIAEIEAVITQLNQNSQTYRFGRRD